MPRESQLSPTPSTPSTPSNRDRALAKSDQSILRWVPGVGATDLHPWRYSRLSGCHSLVEPAPSVAAIRAHFAPEVGIVVTCTAGVPLAFLASIFLFGPLLSLLAGCFGIVLGGLLASRSPWIQGAVRRRWKWGRSPLEVPLDGQLDVVPGRWVRLRGRVIDGTSFESAGGQKGCVVAAYLGWMGSMVGRKRAGQGQVEVHTVALCRIVVGNEVIDVDFKDVRYACKVMLDGRVFAAPLLARRPLLSNEGGSMTAHVHHEDLVVVGDEIEVDGCLVPLVGQEGGGAYRGTVVRRRLVGEPGRPVLLRRLA